jgi:hypothetical protein
METLRRSSVLAPVVLLCVLALGACGQSSPRPVRSLSATAATGVTPPKTVTAHRLRPAASGGLRPGTPMSSSFTGIRGFTNRRDGFAITEIFKASDGTYPVVTTDGGKTWRGRTGPAHPGCPGRECRWPGRRRRAEDLLRLGAARATARKYRPECRWLQCSGDCETQRGWLVADPITSVPLTVTIGSAGRMGLCSRGCVAAVGLEVQIRRCGAGECLLAWVRWSPLDLASIVVYICTDRFCYGQVDPSFALRGRSAEMHIAGAGGVGAFGVDGFWSCDGRSEAKAPGFCREVGPAEARTFDCGGVTCAGFSSAP